VQNPVRAINAAITICIAAVADALMSSWARMIAIEPFHCHANMMIATMYVISNGI
jgi:hypothetical protein